MNRRPENPQGDKHVDVLIKGLTSSALFAGLFEMEILEVSRLAKTRFYEGRTPIIAKGMTKHPLFVILDGQAQVVQEEEGAEPSPIAQLGKGDHFGDMNFFIPAAARVSIIATQATHCALFDADEFKDYLFSHPSIAVKVLWNLGRSLVERLRRTDDRYGQWIQSHRS